MDFFFVAIDEICLNYGLFRMCIFFCFSFSVFQEMETEVIFIDATAVPVMTGSRRCCVDVLETQTKCRLNFGFEFKDKDGRVPLRINGKIEDVKRAVSLLSKMVSLSSRLNGSFGSFASFLFIALLDLE